MRTVIVGGVLARHTGVSTADVAFEDGRIVEVGERLSTNGACVVDATDCIVMPGGVDVHTHLTLAVTSGGRQVAVNDGFYAGTLAAAWGGTTCVVEHPGFGPEECALLHQPESVRILAQGQAVVDYGVHTVFQRVDDRILEDISVAVARGYASGKAYLTYSGRLQDEELLAVLAAMRDAGALTAVHCENHAITAYLSRQLTAAGETGAAAHPRARPALCEVEAVTRVLALARTAAAPLYIVHLSTGEGLARIVAARRDGVMVWAETCPQYLLLDEACYEEGAAEGLKYVMAPALRTPRDTAALWEGLKNGDIDVVATDHCGFTFTRKWEVSGGDVFRCPAGVPGVETRVPLLFSEGVLKGRLTLSRFVQVTAEAPARIMGLENKGRLEPGADADIVILDPAVERQLSAQTLHQSTDFTPFEGLSVRGWPRNVWVRGQLLIEGDAFRGNGECGAFVARNTGPLQDMRR